MIAWENKNRFDKAFEVKGISKCLIERVMKEYFHSQLRRAKKNSDNPKLRFTERGIGLVQKIALLLEPMAKIIPNL